jgi:superfamily II DNA/RNA helicase
VTSTFAELGVPDDLCSLLERKGIAEPFPIQTATLPDALAGRDVCGRAPTGSGKTLAFGLAIAARVGPALPRRPRALVLVPTRELASQVAGEIEALLPTPTGSPAGGSNGDTRPGSRNGGGGQRRGDGRRRDGRNGRDGRKRDGDRHTSSMVLPIYGGASYGPQRRGLARGASVVVACPGRLEDLVEQGDIMLEDVDLVVLDEADRMADMGFLPAVKRLLDRTSPDRQTLLFSATLDREVDTVVRRYQRDPARHDATPVDDEADVEHVFWRTDRAGRAGLAAELVNRHGRAIVFSRTRRGADRLARQLSDAGVDAMAIHGSRTQAQRERALSAFSRGRANALVATDVAARGIHVDQVACVVHYDLPDDPKDSIHRSGRTGRAGASGTVVSFVLDEDRRNVRAIQRHMGFPEVLDVPDVPYVTTGPRSTGRPDGPRDDGPQRSGGAGGTHGGGRNRRPSGGRPTASTGGRSGARTAGQRNGSPSSRRSRGGNPARGKARARRSW